MKADFHNVVVQVEFIVQTPHGVKPDLTKVEAELEESIRNNRWIHASLPRIIHTRTEDI